MKKLILTFAAMAFALFAQAPTSLRPWWTSENEATGCTAGGTLSGKTLAASGGGAASTLVCWMADAKTLGHCTDAGTPPNCTCSQ